MPLPYPVVYAPLCGACDRETSHDGDSFVCEPCGLNYGEGSETERAEFLNPETPECGAIAGIAAQLTRQGMTILPCSLPMGHQSAHWYDGW